MNDSRDGGTGQRSGNTIKDVAALAGVSPSTVSNLLNGRRSKMAPATRDRVERAMDELGFRPSRAARALRTGRVATIGLVVPSVANPFWGQWAQAIESEALRHGLQVLLCNSERDAARERSYVDELRSTGVLAIILGSSLPSLRHLEGVAEDGPLLIAFDREAQVDDPPAVLNLSVDNFAGAKLATEHLLKLGHRRIGFISGTLGTLSRRRRLAGYESALAEAGLPLDELIWADSGQGFGDTQPSDVGYRGMLALLDLPKPPTAVITINDMYALGACSALVEVGRPAPTVSVVGFDDINLANLYNPPLTSVRQPLTAMAAYAIRAALEGRKSNNAKLPHSVVMQPTLIERQSCSPIDEPQGGEHE